MRFPKYESSKNIDVGSAPRVPVSAYGAPGRAIQQAGNQMMKLEARAAAREEQNAMFNAQKSLNDLEAQGIQNLQSNISNSQDGGDIFNNTMTPFDQGVKTIRDNLPKKLQQRFDVMSSSRRKTLGSRAVSGQVNAQRRYYETHIGNSATQGAQLIESNPATYEEELEKIDGMIDNSSLDAGRKNQLRSKILDKYEAAHVRGRAKSGENINTIMRDVDAKPSPQAYNTNVNVIDSRDRFQGRKFERKSKISGIVIHHTAGTTMEGAIATFNKGVYGYNYIIDENAKVHNIVPDEFGVNHMLSHGHRHRTDKGKYAGLNSHSTIGISFVAKNAKSVTKAQQAAMDGLLTQLSRKHGIPKENIVGHGELQGGAGGNKQHDEGLHAATRYRQRVENDSGETAVKEGRIRYQYMTANTRSRLKRELNIALSGQKVQLKEQMQDNISSIRNTGEKVDVNPELMGNLLTRKEIAQYRIKEAEATYEHKATGDIDGLTFDQMTDRLTKLAPTEGEQGFDHKLKVRDKAQDIMERTIKMRGKDPARSVENLPNVKKAMQDLDTNNPDTLQYLVSQRLIAQDSVGIPEAGWSTITKSEADNIMMPIRNAPTGDYSGSLKAVYGEVQRRFGKFAYRVMKDAIRLSLVSKDQRAAVDVDFISLIEETQTSQDAIDANGVRPEEADTRPVGQVLEEEAIRQERLKNAPDAPKPNRTHIQILRNNPTPELIKQFDLKFGSGAANKYLDK